METSTSTSILNTGAEGGETASDQPSIWEGQKVNFPEGFDDSLKETKMLKGYVNEEGDFNFANMMKSHIHLDKMRGNMVKIPSELDTPEDKDNFYEKVLGFNKDPEKYVLEAGEDSQLDPEFHTEFKDFLFKNRIPMEAGKELSGFLEDKFGGFLNNMQEQKQAQIEESITALKDKWGEGFNKELGYAQKVAEEFGGKEFQEHLDKSGLGNDQRLVEFLAGLGKKLYTDAQITEGKSGFEDFGTTPQEAVSTMEALRGDLQGPYWNSSHPNHAQAVQKMDKMGAIVEKYEQAMARSKQAGF